MKSWSFLIGALPVAGHCGLLLVGLIALYIAPPAQGRMLLLPLTDRGRDNLAALAIKNGALLVATGPASGSMLVEGRRDQLMTPLLRRGILVMAARTGGCGGEGRYGYAKP